MDKEGTEKKMNKDLSLTEVLARIAVLGIIILVVVGLILYGLHLIFDGTVEPKVRYYKISENTFQLICNPQPISGSENDFEINCNAGGMRCKLINNDFYCGELLNGR